MKRVLLLCLLSLLCSCQFLFRKYANLDKVGVYAKRSEVLELLRPQRVGLNSTNSLVFRTNSYVYSSQDSFSLLSASILIFDSLGNRRVLGSTGNYCSLNDVGRVSDKTQGKIDIYSLAVADSLWPTSLKSFLQAVVDSAGNTPSYLIQHPKQVTLVFGFSTFSSRRKLKEYKEFESKFSSDRHLILINRDVICEDSLDCFKGYCQNGSERAN